MSWLPVALLLALAALPTTGAERAAPQPPVELPFPPLDDLEPVVAGQLREVRERVQQALRQRSTQAVVYGDAARHYHAYGLWPAAEACYREAVRLQPDEWRWAYLLGVVLEEQGRLDEAAASLERALVAPDKYVPALARVARVEFMRGQPQRAAERLGPVLRTTPVDAAVLALWGEVALALGRPQESVQALSRALAQKPEATRLRYTLGLAYRALGEGERARVELAAAGRVGLKPRDPLLEAVLELRRGEQAFLREGITAFRAGDLVGAEAAFERALASSAGHSKAALVNLAAVVAGRGRQAEALALLERARAVAPDDVLVLANLGALLAHAGRHGEAAPALRRVLELSPGDASARLELGLVLLALERHDEGLGVLASLEHIEAGRCQVLLQRLAALPAGATAQRGQQLAQRFAQANLCR
jgi:tetratricopeptide (TPR) repeat protein